MKTLATISGEGFTSEIKEYEDGRVEFIGDCDIDADGANGQSGAQAAYRSDNKGSEHLANGGMAIRFGKVVGVEPWFKDIVLLNSGGSPLVLPSGVIPSKTAYVFPFKSPKDPAAYVDSETVPYMVVPPVVIQKTRGVVKGCRCRVTNLKNGKVSIGIVADVGPRTKVGEVSIEVARQLGIPHSPRTGGDSRPIIQYELWPGQPGHISGEPLALMRANGTYVV